jgi:hypothetical protein
MAGVGWKLRNEVAEMRSKQKKRGEGNFRKKVCSAIPYIEKIMVTPVFR